MIRVSRAPLERVVIAISWVSLPRACALGWFLRPFGPRDEAHSAIPPMPLKRRRALKGHRSLRQLLRFDLPRISDPKARRNQPRVPCDAQALGHAYTTTSSVPPGQHPSNPLPEMAAINSLAIRTTGVQPHSLVIHILGPKGPRNQPRVTREAQTLGAPHTTTTFESAL